MDEKFSKIIELVKASELDETIKDILVRDISEQGLSDTLKQQILVYCTEGLKLANKQIEETKALLD